MTNAAEPSIHRIDASDRLCFVNEAWLAFARENGAIGLDPESVLGRPIWDFIEGREVSYLFRALLREVRNQRRGMSLPFRCDAPATRREMELELVPLHAGVIEFRSHLERGTSRAPVMLLDGAVARASWHVPICSWCKRVEVSGGAWEDTETAARALGLLSSETAPRLMHTICPDCLAAIRGRAGIESRERDREGP
jgi:hypothetical protein